MSSTNLFNLGHCFPWGGEEASPKTPDSGVLLGSQTSVSTPFILLDLGVRAQRPPWNSPLDPVIVPSSDLCYSKFQQGDLEKTPLAPWRAPRLAFSSSGRQPFSVGGTTGLSALQGQFMALSGARAPRLTPPAAPESPIVRSLGGRERRKGWRPFPTIGDNVRPQTCHTRRRRDMERMCLQVGARPSAFPRKEGEKNEPQTPTPQTAKPSPAAASLPRVLVVTVNAHRKYNGERMERDSQRTKPRVTKDRKNSR